MKGNLLVLCKYQQGWVSCVPRSVWMLRDLCNNFPALPCWQNVPHYQLQQEGNLASSKTKVCIRVNQLFTLFELTQERGTAWSFCIFDTQPATENRMNNNVTFFTFAPDVFLFPFFCDIPSLSFITSLPPYPLLFPSALLSNYSLALLKF